jgi:signal transduction histidine kinase/ActR/RegA family two-component response regulator
LRRRLILLALAAMVPLIALSALLAAAYLQQQREAIRQEAVRHAAELIESVDKELLAQLQLLTVLGQSPILDSATPDLARFHVLAQRFPRELQHWHTVILVDATGRQIVNSGVPFGTALPPLNDPAGHKKLMETGKPVIGNIVPLGPLAKDSIPKAGLRVPVRRDGKILFDLVAVISTAHISSLLSPPGLAPEFRPFLVDAADTIVAAPRSPGLVGRKAAAATVEAAAREVQGVYPGVGLLDVPVMTAFRRSARTGWSGHVAIPFAVYNEPLRRAEWIVGLAGAGALTLTGVFGWLFRREAGIEKNRAQFQERAIRMEALGRMTGGVAHDFNNVLMVILSSIELMQRRKLAKGSERYLAEMRKAAERAAHMTRELSAFSRGMPKQTGILDLNDSVKDVLTMVRQSLRGNIVVTVDLVDGPVPVDIDAIQFDLAVLNLAVNARDAMPEGGTLTIETRFAKFPDRSGRSGVALSISDTGTGVSAHVLPHVFEPFFTTKEVGKGTGLGLSQVYGFAKSCGGLADIESSVGEGTKVTLYLPLAAVPLAAPSPAQEIASPVVVPFAEVKRVLVVEDNDEIRAAAASQLSELGYDVLVAENASRALEVLEDSKVDGLVSDLVMPGDKDGYALAKQVRGRWPDMPIVLMSGYSESANAAAEDGFEVLVKPFPFTDLAEALRRRGPPSQRPPDREKRSV